MTVIRYAQQQDFAAMLEMGRAMHAEGRYSDLPFNPNKLVAIATKLLSSEKGLLLVAESDGELIGMACCYLSSYYFCDEQYASDLFLYVDPKHRGGMAAVKLIKSMETWAAAVGAKELSLGVTNPLDGERIGELYRRLGYTFVGGLYKRRI